MKPLIFFKALGVFIFITVFTAGAVLPGPNDVVTVALDIDPTTINILETKIGIDIVMQHMHESILSSDPVTGDLEPLLARKITILPNRKDIKVTLEKNHKFHTGEPLTAKDVKWTYEQAVTPENAHLVAASLEEIEDIEIIDDYTLVFHHYEPFAPWPENMWIGICSKNYFEKVGRKKFRTQPVGSGTFKFVSRSIGENVIMEAAEGYTYPENIYNKARTKIIKRKARQKKVDFKTLKFISVRDAITRSAMLETGEADLIYGILPHDAKRLGINKKVKVKKTSNVPSFFALATKPLLYPIMADSKFQRALTHAINRNEIIDKVFLGEGYPMYMYASKSELGYDPSVKFEFNPDKSKKLVKASSYKPGSPIILTFTNAVPSSEIIAPIVQKYLKDIGVTVQLQQLEAGVQATYSRNKDRREGHMTLYAWAGGRDPHIRIILTIPSNSSYTSYPGRPSKDILDKLVVQQQTELDPQKRLAVLKKIHRIVTKEPSSIPLYGLNQIYAMRNRIDYTWTPKSAFPFNLTRIKVLKSK
ncbi:MAG: ABC transporter substrate-binding protein [Deltaproteobacteria bacterium]|nr:ABC transporter substrate-binding protein [Deltaproteobacteria bacterium]